MPGTIPVRANNNRLRLAVAVGLLSLVGLIVVGIVSYVAMDRWIDHTVEVRQQVDDWFIAVSHELRTPLNAILGWTVNSHSERLDTAPARCRTVFVSGAPKTAPWTMVPPTRMSPIAAQKRSGGRMSAEETFLIKRPLAGGH